MPLDIIPADHRQPAQGLQNVQINALSPCSTAFRTACSTWRQLCSTTDVLVDQLRQQDVQDGCDIGLDPGEGGRRVLQWCNSGVTMVFQLCYKGVTMVFPCYNGVTMVLQWCYNGVTLASQWCHIPGSAGSDQVPEEAG
jgi:hypothetical protein